MQWLTHWGRVTYICVSKLTIIDSDNGLSPGRRQAIIWTNAVILLTGPLGTYFNEILIEIYIFLFQKIHLKMSSGKWRPFCLGLNVLNGPNWTNWDPLFGGRESISFKITAVKSYLSNSWHRQTRQEIIFLFSAIIKLLTTSLGTPRPSNYQGPDSI